MEYPYEEKISYLSCIDDSNNIVARLEFPEFPANYQFNLETLFFNFKVDKHYKVKTIIRNGANREVVKTENDFILDIGVIGEDKYTDEKHTNGSAKTKIKSPAVNIIDNDMFEFELSVFNQNDELLSSAKTYAIIAKEEN